MESGVRREDTVLELQHRGPVIERLAARVRDRPPAALTSASIAQASQYLPVAPKREIGVCAVVGDVRALETGAAHGHDQAGIDALEHRLRCSDGRDRETVMRASSGSETLTHANRLLLAVRVDSIGTEPVRRRTTACR